MSKFLLIRHGSNPTVGKLLAGRMPGVHLNDEGKAQAETLVERLGGIHIDALYSSPLERTMETAAPLARRLGLEVRADRNFMEVDIGEWTGRDFHELANDPVWRHYNDFRAGTRPPGGELIIEAQERMIAGVERLRQEYPQGTVAIFSHGDPIKCIIAHYIGIPLDFLLRLEISLVSVSIVSVHDYGPRILCVNNTGEVPNFLLSVP